MWPFSAVKNYEEGYAEVMEKIGRLRRNSEFKTVYNSGKAYANSLLVIYVMPGADIINRAGFSVSKKVGNSVVRNKVRRRIKESYRLNSGLLKGGLDMVFVARTRAKGASYKEIESAMISLFKRANIFSGER